MFSIDNTYDAADLRKWAARAYEATDSKLARDQLTELEAARKGGSKGDEERRRELREKYDAALAEADRAGFPIAGGYVADPKVDGVAINLRYERRPTCAGRHARRRSARRRRHAKRPHDPRESRSSLRDSKSFRFPTFVEVRGEIYMPMAEFERMNQAVVAAGEEPFANPRNATAGTLKQLDSRIVAERRLKHCRARPRRNYGRSVRDTQRISRCARRVGHPHQSAHARSATTIDAVWRIHRGFRRPAQRAAVPGVDGVVVRVDRVDLQEELGYTSKFPRWCIAYKYAAEQAVTKLISVDWQVGKIGQAHAAGQHGAGVRCRHDGAACVAAQPGRSPPQGYSHRRHGRHRESGRDHPAGRARRDREAPARIEADGAADRSAPNAAAKSRSNTISAACTKSNRTKRRSSARRRRAAKEGRKPEKIPAPEPLSEADETGRYCINPECPAQFRERIIHFAGRGQMDIDGMGEKVVHQLADAGLLNSFGDIFTLHKKRDAVLELERMGEKKADNLFAGIEAAKSRGSGARAGRAGHPSHRRHGRPHRLRTLRFDRCARRRAARSNRHAQDGRCARGHRHGDRQLAARVSAQPRRPARHQRAARRGREARYRKATATGSAGSALAGKTLVVTGTLEKYKREEIESLIAQHGGRAASSVSKKTDYLVAGENAGTKLDKARKLGVPVISEADFDNLIRAKA